MRVPGNGKGQDTPSEPQSLDRSKVTFSQAEGLAPIPGQLKPRELSKGARVGLWNQIYRSISPSLYDSGMGDSETRVIGYWIEILHDFHIQHLLQPSDEFGDDADHWLRLLKNVCLSEPYNHVFDLIQFIVRHSNCPPGLADAFGKVLEFNHAAYRFSPDRRTILPFASEEEFKSLKSALNAVSGTALTGARVHLERACVELDGRKYADSVRESIHSVESTLKTVSGKIAADLSAALKEFEKNSPIHPALRQGLEKLYGYSSDEKGIRHSLLEEPAKVSEPRDLSIGRPDYLPRLRLEDCAIISAMQMDAGSERIRNEYSRHRKRCAERVGAVHPSQ